MTPTDVASVNISGTTIHSAFGLPCRRKLYPLDSNTLAPLRNKFSKVQLIISDEISMVSKKVFYQIHQRLIEIFNIPNKPFAGTSMLVVGDLYQLPQVNARPVYAASLDFEHPASYVMKDLWQLFKFVELDKVMCQKEDKFFIDVLNKIRVGDVDSNIVKVLKSRFVNLDDHNYPKQVLHIFAENGPVSAHNLMTLNKLPGDLVAIPAMDTIPANSGFTQCQIMAAQNRKQSESRGLARLLKLNLET